MSSNQNPTLPAIPVQVSSARDSTTPTFFDDSDCSGNDNEVRKDRASREPKLGVKKTDSNTSSPATKRKWYEHILYRVLEFLPVSVVFGFFLLGALAKGLLDGKATDSNTISIVSEISKYVLPFSPSVTV
jgi:hypothetical protein